MQPADGTSPTQPAGRRTCAAHRKDGTPCKGPAVTGADKCRMHLGKKAAPVIYEGQLRQLFGKIAPESKPVENPLAAYADFAGRVMAWMNLMDLLLDDLRHVGYESETAGEQIQTAVALYERSMDRANTVLASYARLNIDERLARVEQRKVDLVSDALTATLADLGLSGHQQQQARDGLGRRLRLVAG